MTKVPILSFVYSNEVTFITSLYLSLELSYKFATPKEEGVKNIS